MVRFYSISYAQLMEMPTSAVLEGFNEMIPIRADEILNLTGLESYPYMEEKDREAFIARLQLMQRTIAEQKEIERIANKYGSFCKIN